MPVNNEQLLSGDSKNAAANAAKLEVTMVKVNNQMKQMVVNTRDMGDLFEKIDESMANAYDLSKDQTAEERKRAALAEKYRQMSVEERLQETKRNRENLKAAQEELEIKKEAGLISKADYESEKQALEKNSKLLADQQKLEEKAADSKFMKSRTNAEKLFSMEFGNAQKVQRLKEQHQKALEEAADKAAKEEAENGEVSEETKAELKKARKDVARDKAAEEMNKQLANISKQLDSLVNNAANSIVQYQMKIDTRLAGSQESSEKTERKFDSIYGLIKKNLAISPYVKQTEVLQKLNEATEAGISYNIELRAFLASISEDIATTFNAFDSNLLRLIRLQQADSTAARMGLEYDLTTLFNSYFGDTSYLSDTFDSVSQAIIDLNSTLTKEESLSTEFTLQKWLGAMQSVGVSSQFLQMIAQGINYLGTGNVQALAGNTSLQTLLSLSANRAGKDYADLLVKGLDSSSLNELMRSMVEYLGEIAQDTKENKVLQSAWGGIFGFSLSDLKGIQNIQSSISSIYNKNLNFETAQNLTNTRMSQLWSIMSVPTMLSNIIENVKFSTGMTIANNPIFYGLYSGLSMLQDITGGGPTISVAPWGIGTKFNIIDVLKSTLAGVGLVGTLINAFTGNSLSPDISTWGATVNNVRGQGFSLSASKGASLSATVGTASSKDIEEDALKAGTEESESIQSATGADDENIYKALVRKGDVELVSHIKAKQEEISRYIKEASDAFRSIQSDSKKAISVNITEFNSEKLSYDKGLPIKDLGIIVDYIKRKKEAENTVNNLGLPFAQEEEFTEAQVLNMIGKILSNSMSDSAIPVRLEEVSSMQSLSEQLRSR